MKRWMLILAAVLAFAAPAFALETGRVLRIEAGEGYSWPYLLYVPPGESARTILIIPNSSPAAADDTTVHEKRASARMEEMTPLADMLGTPLLIPVFPRPEYRKNILMQELDADSLTTKNTTLARPDLQLIAMVNDARARMTGAGMKVHPKVLLFGFGQGGVFVNRFILLHPELIRAAAIGAPDGWITLPISKHRKRVLTYPVGLADMQALTGKKPNKKELTQVPLFFFMGSADTEDSTAFADGYDATQRDLINTAFGRTPAERWNWAKTYYEYIGSKAVFRLYDGVGHSLSGQMQTDLFDFFIRQLGKDKDAVRPLMS